MNITKQEYLNFCKLQDQIKYKVWEYAEKVLNYKAGRIENIQFKERHILFDYEFDILDPDRERIEIDIDDFMEYINESI